MIRKAQITVGSLSIECAALDVSATGVRVYVPDTVEASPVALQSVTLRLPDGRSVPARWRWQQGTDIGFEFLSGTAH